jgi:hypothetical protein
MTGFIAYGFLYPNRVSFHEAFEALEPDDGKLSVRFLEGRAPAMGPGYSILKREKEWLSGS